MIEEIKKHLDEYWHWLRDKTILRELKDSVEITTPYLDRHNDYIQIYAKQIESTLFLTDGGYVLGDLEDSGCSLDSPKRKEILRTILNSFGVSNDSGMLVVKARAENFMLRKHNLIQAMLAVNDMFYLASPTIMNIFIEDVAMWFDHHDVRYTPNVNFTGRSGYDQKFDFVIPKSKSQPERMIRAINHPNKQNAELTILAWEDTRIVRPAGSKALVWLNDNENSVATQVMDSLANYDIMPMLWSAKEEYTSALAA